MTPERWAQIEELFHRAAECTPEHRTGLLDEACSDDPELRQKVEALLSHQESAGDHLKTAVRVGLDAVGFPLVGETISHYRIVDGLGGGGMGLVYRAEDVKLGRQVAVKFLPEDSAKDLSALGRFEREARAASALEHPNICPIYEFGEHEGQPFLVMQLLKGQTLRELISAAGQGKSPLEVSRLLDLATQITDGLDAAHRQGIIHRDIKPGNIFVTSQGEAKILDFGLAKLTTGTVTEEDSEQTSCSDLATGGIPRETAAIATPDSFLSRTGVAMGTAGYMSPEQVRGEKLDARTDLFSFGLVLYEMATGQRAFSGDTAPVLHDAILKQIPTPARELNPKIPAKLEAIINRSMEKNREVRYQSAAAMLADLMRLKGPSRPAVRVSAPLKRRLMFMVGSLLILGTVLMAVDSYLRQRAASRLAGRGPVVLADFANTTGEVVFDGTLRQALAIDLEQSPFLNVLSDDRVTATLKLMNRRPNERLTQEVSREICLRSNSKALVVGSIASLGSRFTVALKALNCETADTLGNTQAEAESRGDVLKALRQASDSLRRKLGESLASVEKFSSPLEEATTSSLEALRAYSQGQMVLRDTGSAEAIPYYKRAVELDPDFARAHAALAVAYGNLNQPSQERNSRAKACELRDRVAGRERFSIEADCCAGADVKRAIKDYVQWIQTYPGDSVPHLNLGNRYAEMGQHEKAATEILEYVRLVPDSVLGYGNLIERYLALNRLDEAKAALEQAQTRNLDGFYLRVARYYLGFVEADGAAMQQQVAWAMDRPRAEDVLLSAESDTRAYYGRLAEARSLSRRAVESAKKADAKEAAAAWLVSAALREVEFGNLVEAHKAVVEALLLAPREDLELRALALARAGDTTLAEKLADKIKQDSPSDTMLQAYWLPTIRAAVELDRGNAQRAIESLKEATVYDLGELGPGQGGTMFPAYLRGMAYLKAGQGGQASEQFQNILDHHGLVQNSPLGALAHLQLARARRMRGDTTGARTDYQDFLTLWRDADPDVPILKEAKAEYAKLQ